MLKVTVLYGHPASPESFETYYSQTHFPLVAKVQGITKAEYTKFLPNADGSAPAYYRMAELYFPGAGEMQETMSSEEGKSMAGDLSNFATGCVTILVGVIEN